MTLKVKSIYKRYQFCGGKEVYGTECSMDKDTLEISCTCSNSTLRGMIGLSSTTFSRRWIKVRMI